MADHHPFRDAQLHVFQQIGGDTFIARFHPYDTYPIFWHGSSETDVRNRAEAFRKKAIAKNEAAFIARQAAALKAKKARAMKAEAK